ncbi:MAG: hypothetical protein PHV59_10935, partial [Victivallales bacterium]|nr:hypothetical protein [Victivallales bacterium]
MDSLNKRKLILIDDKTGDFAGFLKDEDKKPAFILPFVKGTDREVNLQGKIVTLKPGAVYVTHALVQTGKPGELKTLAYLHCRDASLNIWQRKTVNISGTQKLVSDWKLPVIEVKTVIPAGAEAGNTNPESEKLP